jgi:hypothetical protein
MVEYFRATSSAATWKPRLGEAGRLGTPRQISGSALEERLWPVVARQDGYEPSADDRALEFGRGMPPHMWVEDIYFRTLRDRIDIDEGKRLPRMETPAPQYEVQNIMKALAELEGDDGNA